MTEPLWTPSAERLKSARLGRFMKEVRATWDVNVADYGALHAWSIAEPAQFWRSMWDLRRHHRRRAGRVHRARRQQDAGRTLVPRFARLNYAENLLRRRDEADALVFWGEERVRRRLSFADLHDQVSRMAQALGGSRRPSGGPGRGLPAEHAGDHRLGAGDGKPRRRLVLVLVGFRHARCARPLRPDCAQGAGRRRRLFLRRQDLRPQASGARNPVRASLRGARDRGALRAEEQPGARRYRECRPIWRSAHRSSRAGPSTSCACLSTTRW